jgi:hypothetical protein
VHESVPLTRRKACSGADHGLARTVQRYDLRGIRGLRVVRQPGRGPFSRDTTIIDKSAYDSISFQIANEESHRLFTVWLTKPDCESHEISLDAAKVDLFVLAFFTQDLSIEPLSIGAGRRQVKYPRRLSMIARQLGFPSAKI